MNRRFNRALLCLVLTVPLSAGGSRAQVAPRYEHERQSEVYAPTPFELPRPEFWMPDHDPNSQSYTLAHNRLYIGGCVQVGPYTGPFGVLDATTGDPELSWPKTDGHVNVVIGDGFGGWWLGGHFSKIGTRARDNLAHVFSDGTVDMRTPAMGSEVNALKLYGHILYVGGNFQVAGGLDRRMAAAIDTNTGAVLPWRPFVLQTGSSSNRVYCIEINGATVYLGGYFDYPNYPRKHFTAVDYATGSMVSGPNLDPNDSVMDLVLSGSTLYVGGNFTQIAGVARGRLAGINVNTGVASHLNPGFSNTVWALALSGTTLYVGGIFQTVGGQPRGSGAAVSVPAGTLLPWDPQVTVPEQAETTITDLLVDGNEVHVAGSFRSLGGQPRFSVGRVDGTVGTALPWGGNVAGPSTTFVQSIARQGNRLACAGNFHIVGGVTRKGAAALDLDTGQPTPWNPDVAGAVLRILVDGNTAYIGGSFTSVNGDARIMVASVDAHTGATNTAFDAGPFHPQSAVRSMALKTGTLFVGGSFNTPIPGQNNLIALDSITGAIVPGSTNVSSQVIDMALSADQSRLYLAGSLNDVGMPPVPRTGLAAIDTTTGNVLPWDPRPNQAPNEVHFLNGRVWAAGNFSRIGYRERRGLVALDPVTGAPAPELRFAPVFRNNGSATSASSLALYGEAVIAAGTFNTANQFERDNLAAFLPDRGSLLDWTPAVGRGVTRILTGEGVLVVNAAWIRFPTGESRPGFAVYNAP